MNLPWTKAQVTITYATPTGLTRTTHVIDKEEYIAKERARMMADALRFDAGYEEGGDERHREIAEGLRARAERFDLDDKEFKQLVHDNALLFTREGFVVPHGEGVKIIPPSSIIEILVEPVRAVDSLVVPS